MRGERGKRRNLPFWMEGRKRKKNSIVDYALYLSSADSRKKVGRKVSPHIPSKKERKKKKKTSSTWEEGGKKEGECKRGKEEEKTSNIFLNEGVETKLRRISHPGIRRGKKKGKKTGGLFLLPSAGRNAEEGGGGRMESFFLLTNQEKKKRTGLSIFRPREKVKKGGRGRTLSRIGREGKKEVKSRSAVAEGSGKEHTEPGPRLKKIGI